MSPGLGVILFGGLGYVLVYASVANHGRFALHPWLGLLADAYTGETSTASDAGNSPAPASPGPSPSSRGSLAPASLERAPVRNRAVRV